MRNRCNKKTNKNNSGLMGTSWNPFSPFLQINKKMSLLGRLGLK